jgi:hypothetical protein
MITVMAILAMTPRLDAAFIPSAGSTGGDIYASDMNAVRQFLEQKAVKNRLEALGYSSEEIQDRLSILSDHEIHQLAANIDTLTTGGDGLGLVIGILVVILLVIVILKITDKRIIIR